MTTTPKAVVCLLAAPLYLVAMIWLSGLRPLWLDEILQLLDTRQPSAVELINRLPANHIGSAPLGYLTQQLALKVSGYSVRRARLTAAIFGTAAVLATLLLGVELGLKNSGIGTMLFAAFPMTLRYASEARPYSQALFFSLVATLLYVRLSKKPHWMLAAAYTLALAAAAYTQPYSASVGLAHVLWSLLCRDRKVAAFGALAVSLAVASFLPWYRWSQTSWATGIATNSWNFQASIKTPLVLFRELTGAGYWGSGLLVILCVLAWKGGRSQAHLLLVLLTMAPVTAALAADLYFGYFLAARQFLWVLPPLAMLAADHRGRAFPVLLTLLGAVCVWPSIRLFAHSRENWQAAADVMEQSARRGTCLLVAPPNQIRLYEFFHPGLGHAGSSCTEWLLAITPYATSGERNAAQSALRSLGYRWESETAVGGSQLVIFRRRVP